MKHSSSQAVYAYWNETRGTRPAPERGDIDPAAIRRALGDTVMLSADFVDRWRFRLAGTRVCALFNREIKGEALTPLFGEADQATIEKLAANVTEGQMGVVMGLVGRTDDATEVDLEMLLLPIAHAGHARIRALGVLAPLSPPYWLGSKAVTEMRLTALRHIGPEIDTITAGPSLAPSHVPGAEAALALPRGGRIRRGFVVYNGGREVSAEPDTN